MNEPIRVLLVDTPALFRRSLASILNRRRSLQVVGEVGTGAEAILQLRAQHPDVIVIEPSVNGGGTALISELYREGAGCAILVLTTTREESAATLALQAGARGYLHKECEIEDLVRAIERIHAGELVVTRVAAETVVKGLSGEWQRDRPLGGLTAREIEVLQLVALGRTNPQIANELCITEHTVKAHLAKILGKMGMENRVQLVAYALQQGLTLPSDSSDLSAVVTSRHPSIG